MNKRELTAAFAKEIGLTLRDAEVCVNTLFNSMADTLAQGGRVEIRGRIYPSVQEETSLLQVEQYDAKAN
jgi:hypothetical protein